MSLQMEKFIYSSIWQDYSEPKKSCNGVLTSTFYLPMRAIPIAFIGHCSWAPPERGIFMSGKGTKNPDSVYSLVFILTTKT